MTFYASGREGKPLQYHGLTWNRWLGTVLQSMGIPRSDYERNGGKGYGHPFVGKDYGSKYVSGVFDSASEVLPFLNA